MVDVKVFIKDQKDKENIIGFKIKGHANFATKGQDIVCSAISVLAQTTLLGLDEYLRKGSFKYSIKDGYMSCMLESNLTTEERKTAQILLKTMYLGMKSVEENYASYVRIIKEV